MFAVAADDADNVAGVWKSTDGGVNWALVTLPAGAGAQGWYNNAIAVSSDCKIVTLGWESGTFVSYDSGGSWGLLSSPGGDLHPDIHGLTFDASDPTTLFIGSDGGVASVQGLGPGSSPTFTSYWNRQLFNLQFYHGDASSAASGLVAGGTQDNSVLWASLPGPWQNVTDCGCDGRWSRFFTTPNITSGNSILLEEEYSGSNDYPFNGVIAKGNSIPYSAQTTIPVSPPNPPALGNVLTEIVTAPGGYLGYANASGETLFGASGTATQVYGLFAKDDGSDLHWELLGEVGGGQNVSAISPTYNGGSVFVGTDQGNIYRLDAPYAQTALQLTINAPSGVSGNGGVSGLAAFYSWVAYATMNYGGNGYVMYLDGSSWNSVGSSLPHDLPFNSIVARDTDHVFVGTDTAVYDTSDRGYTWTQATNGLPQMTRGRDLRTVTEPSGATYLYLFTNGRSVWRAKLPPLPTPRATPTAPKSHPQ
jgi:hypothetical protein